MSFWRSDDSAKRKLATVARQLAAVSVLEWAGMGKLGVRWGLAATVAEDKHAASVDKWDEIADEYARAFFVTPRDRLLQDLTADLSALQQAYAGSDDATKCHLSRVAGQLDAMSALEWAGMGELRQARRWWRTARQLADRSGDAETRTWVRGWEVVDGLEEQRSVSSILDQGAGATSIAGHRVSAGSAALCGGLAQTLSVAGRRDEALAALGRAADITDKMPARVVADEDSILGWPEVRLRHAESYVYTWLGDTIRAYAAQDRALELYPESLTRARGKMLLHRAACVIRDGDVGGGLSYATQVLDALPAEQRTDEGMRAIGRAVMRFVPAQERGRPEALALRERLGCPQIRLPVSPPTGPGPKAPQA